MSASACDWAGRQRVFNASERCTYYLRLSQAIFAQNTCATCSYAPRARWSRDLWSAKHWDTRGGEHGFRNDFLAASDGSPRPPMRPPLAEAPPPDTQRASTRVHGLLARAAHKIPTRPRACPRHA